MTDHPLDIRDNHRAEDTGRSLSDSAPNCRDLYTHTRFQERDTQQVLGLVQ